MLLSVSVNTLKSLPPIINLNTPSNHLVFLPSFSNDRRSISFLPKPSLKLKPISATLTPSPIRQQQLYKPFRPPPSPSPSLPSQFGSLDTPGRIEVLANRLGLWYEYAPLIPSLIQQGFSPTSIEDATAISVVEQNCLVVASQVRDSLVQSNADPDILSAFDTGGAELLYEIRLLSATQRAAAARHIVQNRLDGMGAQELARAIKDFPSRRGEKGWENFDYTLPADCLSFMHYRQSREHRNPSEQRTAALEQALRVAETEKAKSTVFEELKGEDGGKEDSGDEIDRGGPCSGGEVEDR